MIFEGRQTRLIERYQTAEMRSLWSEENKFRTWLEVELAVCRTWTERDVIPRESMADIEEKADFDLERIREIEATVHHDVIAFVSSVAEKVGENGRYIHLGLTSSDVIDTAAGMLLRNSLDIILEETRDLAQTVLKQAHKYKETLCVGRTHGIHGEPMTFGLKLLNWYSQLQRDLERLEDARKQVAFGKISGAVGTYAHCPPEVEERVCEMLGLEPAPVSTQILQRDRHAQALLSLGLLGTTMERIATEIRHLQRTEVLEALEPFGKGQKGSSAMPHKKNPILCERLCGIARLLRGYSVTAMENVALWHERDISHSSAERVIWPDAFQICHYGLKILHRVVGNLNVQEKKMMENLNLTRGLVFSQRVLLELVEKFDLQREEAYAIVQDNAMKCWNGEGALRELLEKDPRIGNRLSAQDLADLFDFRHYTRHVDRIFSRFQDLPRSDDQVE